MESVDNTTLFARGNLDSPTFDPISFLNDIFPDEKSLTDSSKGGSGGSSNGGISKFVAHVNSLVKVLDNDISTAIQKQAEEGDQG